MFGRGDAGRPWKTVSDLLTAVTWALLVSLLLACSLFALLFATSPPALPGGAHRASPLAPASAEYPAAAIAVSPAAYLRLPRLPPFDGAVRPATCVARPLPTSSAGASPHALPAPAQRRASTPLALPPGGAPPRTPRLPLPGRRERRRSGTNSSSLSRGTGTPRISLEYSMLEP